mgnify:CR=1 FL=1
MEKALLIIEDKEDILSRVAKLLSVSGYKVIAALTGSDGINAFQTKAKNISLVLLDFNLPDIGGAEVFNSLKEIDPGVKVVIASGYVSEEAKRELMKAGAKGFVQKPYTFNEITDEIERILSTSEDSESGVKQCHE